MRTYSSSKSFSFWTNSYLHATGVDDKHLRAYIVAQTDFFTTKFSAILYRTR